MKKSMARAAAFCLGLVVLLVVSSLLLRPKSNTAEAGFLEPEAGAVTAEPEDTLDVLFLGDSTVRYGIRPKQIWKRTGITSYNCATNAQKLYETEEYLSVALERQSPKVVMLEIDIFFTPQTELNVLTSRAERLFPVLRYHNRWKTLHPEKLLANADYSVRQSERGFVPRDEVAAYGGTPAYEPTDETAALSGCNLRCIRRIAAQCRERDIRLVLLSVPSADGWDYYRHNTAAALAKELGGEFVDLNLLQTELGIDWQTDTFDYGVHLNVCGAEKVSDYLADYLTATGLFTDKRADARYADWSAE